MTETRFSLLLAVSLSSASPPHQQPVFPAFPNTSQCIEADSGGESAHGSSVSEREGAREGNAKREGREKKLAPHRETPISFDPMVPLTLSLISFFF